MRIQMAMKQVPIDGELLPATANMGLRVKNAQGIPDPLGGAGNVPFEVEDYD